eukprot:NODE_22979_length_686_cov_2.550984.p4 GENE.NODE_22979_length_686_cov_2.550984~~NODE_22979_length_686_cov_2.550984.p4  ORF type:complete len:58 (+),score=4.99 NODE_22979_length_686_cov_2.550984:246-419(+)
MVAAAAAESVAVQLHVSLVASASIVRELALTFARVPRHWVCTAGAKPTREPVRSNTV